MSTSKFIFLLAILLSTTSRTHSQNKTKFEPSELVPFDPKIRKGILPNGFKYYITKDTTKKTILIRFIVKAGFAQQSKRQFESPHILEHILMRRGDQISQAKIPILFDPQLKKNAHTAIDYTIYSYELSAESIQITHILSEIKDWIARSTNIQKKDYEVEKSIVIEENRSRGIENEAEIKALGQLTDNKAIFKTNSGSKIRKTSLKETKKFFHKWYQPNQSGLIISGNVDEQQTLNLITAYFGDIQNQTIRPAITQAQSTKRYKNQYGVSVYPETHGDNIKVRLFFKAETPKLITYNDYKTSIVLKLCNEILNWRLSNIESKEKDSVFNELLFNYQSNLAGASGFELYGIPKSKKHINACLNYMFEELIRTTKYGFTPKELEMSKSNSRHHTVTSQEQANKIVNAFLYNEVVPAISIQANIHQEILDSISCDDLNWAIKAYLSLRLLRIAILAPSSAKRYIPNKKEILRLHRSIDSIQIQPHIIPVHKPPIIDFSSQYCLKPIENFLKIPISEIDVTQIKLDNGATVLLKQGNPQQEGRIFFKVSRPIGTLSYKDSALYSSKVTMHLALNAGLGELSGRELRDYLIKSDIDLNAQIEKQNVVIEGSSPTQNIEIALQLIYRFFQPFHNNTTQMSISLKGLKNNSKETQRNSQSKTLTNSLGYNIELERNLSQEELKKVTIKKCIQVYNECFSGIKGSTIVISGVKGNIDTTINIVARYLGNIQQGETTPTLPCVNYIERKSRTDITETVNSIPKSRADILLIFTGSRILSEKQQIMLKILTEVLEQKLYKRIREKEGATYDLNSGIEILKKGPSSPLSIYQIKTTFSCAPDRTASLIKNCMEEIEKLKQEEPQQSILINAIEKYKKHNTLSNFNDSRWCSYLLNQTHNDGNLNAILAREQLIKSITPSDITEITKEVLQEKSLISYIEFPEKEIN